MQWYEHLYTLFLFYFFSISIFYICMFSSVQKEEWNDCNNDNRWQLKLPQKFLLNIFENEMIAFMIVRRSYFRKKENLLLFRRKLRGSKRGIDLIILQKVTFSKVLDEVVVSGWKCRKEQKEGRNEQERKEERTRK